MFAAALAAAVALSVCASSALAGWSAPQSFMGSTDPSGTAVAVDSRGDAAVVWRTGGFLRGLTAYSDSVQLVARLASGRLVTRTVWRSHVAQVRSVSVAIGDGQVTVAWSYYDRAGREAVAAAYGPLVGRWSVPQTLGRETEMSAFEPGNWHPNLAVAPDGEVLLAWDTFNANNGIAVAWRSPHHPFGAAQSLAGGPEGATPQFDARGNAYLSSSCDGTVLVARAHSHHFRSDVLTAASVVGFSLSVSGPGRGLAVWVDGQCSFGDEAAATSGPVFASVLRTGMFGTPLALTPADAQDYGFTVVAVDGGGTVTWFTDGPPTGTSPPALPYTTLGFSVQFGADGLPGATQQITADEALAADGGGDVVLAPPTSGFFTPAGPVLVRPAGGGADQSAPAPMRPPSYQVAVAAPIGRAAALTWHTSPTGGGPAMELSVWRQ